MMKYENSFTHYLNDLKCGINLHPQKQGLYNKLPSNVKDLQNIILYGPKGIGKYTQCLELIERYSPSKLKYENKFTIHFQNKHSYNYKISDIHYEVDMSLLGCNAKNLWGDIFQQILDIISIKQDKYGIIVCKYFHEINSELLEVFYTYMHNFQTSLFSNINIKFILITEELSFIPDDIINISNIISFNRPTKSQYNKLLPNNLKLSNYNNINEITNIKNIKLQINQLINPQEKICNKIIAEIIDIEIFNIANIREYLYDLLIYNINIYDSVFYILQSLNNEKHIDDKYMTEILDEIYVFLKQYNNNYRPIFHLERCVLYLCKKVHGDK